jgi:HK97 family phage prohead protease
MERRYLSFADLGDDGLGIESRDGEPTRLRGISPPWDSLSVDLGGFREKFMPTAFDKIIGRHKNDPRGVADVVGLFNHDDNQVLSRTTNGTLRLEKQAAGLAYEMDLPDTQLARDLKTLVAARTVFGSSFAFTTSEKGEQWVQDERGQPVRIIHEASGLFDISVVTRAAYPSSSVGLRSLEAWKAARAVESAAETGLTISLDFDQTYTAAPGLWRSFILDARERGHRVVLITRREDTAENQEAIRLAFGDLFPELAAAILCGPERQKRQAAADAGLSVDVWIDDKPETIPEAAPAPRSFKVSTELGARAAAAAAIARMRANEHAG